MAITGEDVLLTALDGVTIASGASQSVNEYGLFSASTDGTMLARVSSGDAGGPAEKTVANGETITVTWNITWADA